MERHKISTRVLHVISGLGAGGAESALCRLVGQSMHSVHQEVVSMTDEGAFGERLTALGVRVHTLGMRRGRITLRGIRELRRLLKATRPSVVQTWMYHADLMAGLTARIGNVCPVVWGLRSAKLTAADTSFLTRAVIRVNARISRSVPRLIVSASEEGAAVHKALGYDASKIRVIANGYDVAEFQPSTSDRDALRKALGMSPDEILIGCVARWDTLKDHENLLQAVALVRQARPNTTCVLAGDGMTRANDSLMDMIRRSGVERSVRLLGRRTDVPAIMNAIDLHVLSSYSEAFPNVLAEAMACGTPCVSTQVGDAALILGDAGWVVPPKNPRALASAMQHAIEEMVTAPDIWYARQGRGRQRIVDSFSLEQMARRYIDVWNEVSATV